MDPLAITDSRGIDASNASACSGRRIYYPFLLTTMTLIVPGDLTRGRYAIEYLQDDSGLRV